MTSKIVNAVKNGQKDMWSAFKAGISIKGYHYYEAPEEIKYRYPAPGSCAMDEEDHPNLYKNDWKVPFRTSDYNIRPIELQYRDDDPRQAQSYVSGIPKYDTTHPIKGKYDQTLLNEA